MTELLLIEPDRLLAATYYQALSDAGYRVTAAGSAQAAILAADRIIPELVVLELQLVEHSGIEFLYEFRSYPEWQGIPVIIQTQVPVAEFKDSWRLLSAELGVKDYLYKPETSLRRLIATVEEQLPLHVPA